MISVELINEELLRYYREEPFKIAMGQPEEIEGPRGTYGYQPFEFEDQDMRARANGGLYLLPKNTPSRTVLLTGKVVCRDFTVGGSAWALEYNPRRGVDTRLLDTRDRGYQMSGEYRQGTVVAFIARNEGARILEVCMPRFTDKMEVHAGFEGQEEIGGVSIPRYFWERYQRLHAI